MPHKTNNNIISPLNYAYFISVPCLIYFFYSWAYPIIFNEDRYYHNLIFDNPDGIDGDYKGQLLWIFIARIFVFLEIPNGLEFTVIFSVIAITYALLFRNNPLMVIAIMLSPAVVEVYLYYSRQGVATSWFLFFYFLTEFFRLFNTNKYKLISFASFLIHTYNWIILIFMSVYIFFIEKSKGVFNTFCILIVLSSLILGNYIKIALEDRTVVNNASIGNQFLLFSFLFIVFVIFSYLKDFNYPNYIIVCLFFTIQLVMLSLTTSGVRSSYTLILLGAYFLQNKYIKIISVLYLYFVPFLLGRNTINIIYESFFG